MARKYPRKTPYNRTFGLAEFYSNPDFTPVRKIAFGTKAKGMRTKFMSHKMDRIQTIGARGEKALAALMEVCPEVTAYYPQPEKILFQLEDGSKTHHVPDFRVETTGGVFMVEVKPRSWAKDVIPRTRLLKEEYRRRNIRYLVITDEWAFKQPRLSNAYQLGDWRTSRLPDGLVHAVADVMASRKPTTLLELEAALPVGLCIRGHLYSLAARQYLRLSLSEPLGDNSRILGFTAIPRSQP